MFVVFDWILGITDFIMLDAGYFLVGVGAGV
jgi:hypothetical protein